MQGTEASASVLDGSSRESAGLANLVTTADSSGPMLVDPHLTTSTPLCATSNPHISTHPTHPTHLSRYDLGVPAMPDTIIDNVYLEFGGGDISRSIAAVSTHQTVA